MPWHRGDKSVDVELSHIQSWIEQMDPELNGNGRKGMIQQFWEDRSFMKGAAMVAAFFAGGDLLIQILRLFGLVK